MGGVGYRPTRGLAERLQTVPEPQPAAASPWLRHARTLVTAALLAVLFALGWRHAGELDRLASARPLSLLAMAACVIAVRALHSEIIRQTLAELGHRLARFEVFALTVLAAVPNMLVPRSGFGALGVALRARHGVPLASTGSLVLPLAVMDLIVVSAAGLGAQALLFGFADPRARWIAAVFAAVWLAAVAGLFVRVRVPFAPARLQSFLARLGTAWTQLRGSGGFLLRATALLAAISALRALRLWLGFGALGVSPQPAGLLVASLLGDVMFLFALTPGALGLREAAIVYCAGLAGVTPAESLAAAVLDRLVMMGATLIAAQLCAWKLLGRPGARL
jgi:uncharacterized membrane protein YbhN (UPF0104 family)